jgi:DNA-binding NtrC family response regulator
MITGESGTGKEVMAKYIHRKSRRKNGPFISVNCAAIPENLLESELFGHEKGAFTGAVARRIGKFEEASGGTLLLDEISEMHPKLQAKLLRAIQEREIDRIGGTQPVKVNIRLIATSNRDLEAEVKAQNFREDLYYRLNVVGLKLPSLRERPMDIEVLANFFVDKYSKINSVPLRKLSSEAKEALRMNPWPGNVRELENLMHRAVLLAMGDEIESTDVFMHLPKKVVQTELNAEGGASSPPMVGRTVAEVERDLIIGTLTHCLGNRTHAANILGISIRTLRNKLNQYTQEGASLMSPTNMYKTAGG